jgi:hypothetical protein
MFMCGVLLLCTSFSLIIHFPLCFQGFADSCSFGCAFVVHRIALLLLPSPPVFDLLLSLAHSGNGSARASAIVNGIALPGACRGNSVYDCGYGNSGQNACNYIAPVVPPAIDNQEHG